MDSTRLDKRFWSAVESTITEALCRANAEGFAQALRGRSLMAWLHASLATADDKSFDGVPWQSVLAVKVKWRNLRDNDPQLTSWYEAWEKAGLDTAAVMARLTGRSDAAG